MWDTGGRLMAQGEYRNNQRTGIWLRWYRNVAEAPLLTKMPYPQFTGPFVSQATFNHDKLDGTWTIYDGKLRKISQWRFVDGKRTGNSLWWYPDGRKMRDVEYFDGELDGTALEWSSEGKLIASDTYQSGRRLGRKTTQYPGGGKKSQGVYLFAKESEQTPDDWWNCKTLVTASAGHDEKHGAWSSWHSNGQRQLQGAYEHDLKVGPFTWWHSNGQKALEGRFEHGKQAGRWIWWYANGQKSIQGEYANGNPTGHWTWWKQDGRVVESADLSQAEGVVVDTPRLPDDSAPRTSRSTARSSIRR
jgi:antitoxin component YwqK of YwqJK toxin-antitoxin module